MEFRPFPKIARLSKDCTICEKIDGTNGSVWIGEDGEIRAGSRNRFITPENDNHGFALWVKQNAEELKKLGPGVHFGEWWGVKIQRGYDLHERRFSLFKAPKLNLPNTELPSCVSIVPVLYTGTFDTAAVETCLDILRNQGSMAAPGYMKPEGVVVYHSAAGVMFKKTLEGDSKNG